MLIDKVFNEADKLYQDNGPCLQRCNHPSGHCSSGFTGNENNNTCYKCAKEIHYHHSYRGMACRDNYSCQKLIYYYTCRYTWKYCSEILYALKSLKLEDYKSYEILSLGCGQCPDLMAIEQINQFEGKQVTYVGQDINPLWRPIHRIIKRHFDETKNVKCILNVTDSIDALMKSKSGFKANMIILSYLISSFPDYERTEHVNQLFDLIIEKVLPHKQDNPVLILINDIDEKRYATRYYDTIVEKIRAAGYHVKVSKKHFGNREGKGHQDESVQYQSYNNMFDLQLNIKDRLRKYDGAFRCSSAQLILEVE